MRVMVTGASGDFGSCIIPEILGRGHEVVGLSRREHRLPSPRYRHVSADIRDTEALTKALADIDAVVHLAWTTHPMHDAAATHAIDVGGTQAVVTAMGRTGVSRLVTASSVMSYGANADNPAALREGDPLRPSAKHLYSKHKVEAEELISASSLDAVLVRATNIMGRATTGVTQEGFATPAILGMKGGKNEFQFVHPDDLARFFADALEHPQWSGPINLAAPDTITMPEVAEILGKRYVELAPQRVETVLTFLWERGWFSLDPGAVEAFLNFPLVDTTRLTAEFGFHCAYSSRECVKDFARTNRGHVFLGVRKVPIPWRWPWGWVPDGPSGVERQVGAPEGVSGEFDTSVHPNWQVFTAANTSEAFPGPMTPLSLELAIEALRAAGAQAAEVLRIGGELGRALREEPVGAFGHGIYANLSIVYAMGTVMPGGGASAWQDMLFGTSGGAEVPTFEAPGAMDMLKRLPLAALQLSGFGREIRDIQSHARRSAHDGVFYAQLSDAQLHARLRRIRDEVANAWAASAQASSFVVPLMGLIEKQGGKGFATRIRGGTDGLVSAGVTRGTYALAAMAKTDPLIGQTLQDNSAAVALVILRRERPKFVAKLDEVVAEYGHRGPRETELSNAVFADAPERLLDVVAKLLVAQRRVTETPPEFGLRLKVLASLGARFQRLRETARDATIRQTHQYRLVAREIGTRLAARGVIDSPNDVFYLVRDELKNPPVDVKAVIARRRAERERLEIQRPPLHFAGEWAPDVAEQHELMPGESLQGSAVSAGLAKGPVRVLTVDSMDDLEPGEVLVTAFTDTGWTPFFAYAAAVIVDTGGEMSHAAVVAREFGIPCVVGTLTGSKVLKTGHVVEVDGASGVVTRVE
ncbi:NAD-dependent epimerase/dehydratase family protein [Mycobacterium vicinigordonae]|uniref:NAD-dependent epimerase/dehydratase family protein n=1 Tax=Mycobacterium vicinigordonae TaxID=1719132 RepID=A0A7D6E2N6_9MYCO|nr:NAD-dependent epimerase/dehydratase family protein [Mycobacterium vicinigordonae]QLL09809.1 NAD-dependent epimerase/dehydratase family protein [Mycobacterium vicinigordonae]